MSDESTIRRVLKAINPNAYINARSFHEALIRPSVTNEQILMTLAGTATWGTRTGFKMGTYTTATSTGSASVTGVGFKPKGLIVFGGYADSAVAHNLAVGATDGTVQVSIANAGSTTPTAIRNIEVDAFYVSTDSAGVILKEFAFTSFDDDGFTFNRVTNNATAYTMVWIAIG